MKDPSQGKLRQRCTPLLAFAYLPLCLGGLATFLVLWLWEISEQGGFSPSLKAFWHYCLLVDALLEVWLLALVVYLGLRAERHLHHSSSEQQQLQTEIERRRQVEASLRASEERWQLVMQGNHDGIWDWNLTTNEVLFSETWKTMLGFAPQQISNQFTEWSQRVHPEDLPRVYQTLQAYFDRTTSYYSTEYRMQCQDGTYKWILDRGQALWDQTGKAIRMVGSHTDITARKQAELALQTSETRYRELVSHLHAGVVVHAPDTRIMSWNQTACEVLGLTPEQLLGKTANDPLWQLTRDDGTVMPLAEYPVNQVLATQQPRYNRIVGVQHHHQARRWVLMTAFPEFDPQHQLTQVVVTFIDITRLKQAEADLRSLTHVMEHVVSGIAQLDLEGHYCYVNQAYATLMGYLPGQLLGLDWQRTVHPEDLAQLQQAYQEMRQTGKVELEVRGQRQDGSAFYKQVVIVPTYDEHQHFNGHYCFLKDISDRKQAELALQQELIRSRTLFETSIDGIVILNAQGDVVQTSPSFAAMLGYTVAETMQLNVADWDAQWTAAELRQILAANVALPPLFETYHQRQDGSVYAVEISYSTMALEGETFHFCICRNISDRKQAEIALQNSQARFAGILDIASDAIISINSDQQITLFNRGAEVIFGYAATEVLGQPLSRLLPDRFTTAHQHYVQHYTQSADQTRPMAERGEIFGRRKDGTEFPAEASISKLQLQGEVIFTVFLRDISDRKQAEALLLQSEEKFRMAIDFTYNWEYWQAPDGTFIYVSPSCERITGYNPTEFIEQPQLLQTIVHPADYDRLIHHDCAEVDTDAAMEFRVIHRNGELRWISHVCQPVFNAAGKYLGRRSSNRDVSERVELTLEREQAVIALRQSEATKQAIIEAIPDLLLRMRADGTYIDFISNKNFNIIKPEDLQPETTVFDILQDDLAQLRLHYSKQALTSGQIQTYEHEIIVDGNCCYEEIRIVPLFQNELLVMVRNISDRKQAESDLRHQKELFQAIVNHIPVMITLFNDQGQFQLINPAVERIMGWSAADWQHADMLTRCYPDVTQHEQVLSFMQAATGEWQEMDTMTASGRQIATSWANVRLSNGYYLGIGQDVSDRKQKEAAVLQAMAAAEAANRAKSMFLANMSHELRTPLNVILGFAEVMTHDPALTPTQLQDLQTIHRSGDHLLRLINDILDISKIEAGHTAIETAGFDLIALLHTIRSMMTERAKAKGLQLVFEIAPQVPQFVRADEHKLRQILLNLLSNAIKFTSQGSITVQVQATSLPDVTTLPLGLPERSPAVRLEVAVTDTGIGLAPADHARIFDAFIQADGGKHTVTGTGLGLAICRKLLELMQGEITVQSVPQQGSTFRFSLPVQTVSSAQASLEESDRVMVGLRPGQGGRRILVVDDEPANRQLLVRLMSRLGLEVREADNGQEAIRLWQEWQPHLTWMDIRMPHLDGYAATKQMRALAPNANRVIIALTAQASRSDRALSLAAGCDDYVSKPFREQTLLLKLQEHLRLEILYQDATETTLAGPEAAAEIDWLDAADPFSPLHLPPVWIEALENAALSCHDQAIEQLLQQLPPEYAHFCQYIATLTFQFQFERILALTQQLKQHTAPRQES